MPVRFLLSVLVAAVAAPGARACEDPDNIRYTLRARPPAVVHPGEFVLELDVGSRTDVTEAPTLIEVGGHKIEFPNYYAVFDVRRVHAGDFTERQVRIPYLPNSCSSFSYGPDASYFVGYWRVGDDGKRDLMVRGITLGELRSGRGPDDRGRN